MFRVLLSVFLFLSPVALVAGADVLYVNVLNGGSGNWFTLVNWLVGGVTNLIPSGSDNAFITQAGTYTVTVDQDLSLTGSLTLGSDTATGVNAANATLSIQTGQTAFFGAINLQSGGRIDVSSNAELWVTTLTITSQSAVITGSGKLFVNGSLVYSQPNGYVSVDVFFNTTGGVTVTNGGKVNITSSGLCAGGSLNLGTSGQGGELVISGNWWIGTCLATGGGGNLTFQSTTSQTYTGWGGHVVAYLKVNGNAQLNVSSLALQGDLWVGGNAFFFVTAKSSVQGDVWVVALGTYIINIDANLTVSGEVTLGSDTTTGVNPTLWVGAGASVDINALTLQSGGHLALTGNAKIATLTFTGANHTVTASGGSVGTLVVTATFFYSKSGGLVTVSAPFNLSGSASITNNSHVKIVSGGWCDQTSGGAIVLGSVGQGGELEITGTWNHGNCFPSGGGGNFTFNSATVQNYALAFGTYGVAYLKALAYSSVWATTTAVDVAGNVWLADSAKFIVNQTVTVKQAITATGSAVVELQGGAVNAANVTFGSATTYIVHAASATPPAVTASAEAIFAGTLHVVSVIKIYKNVNVTIASYASHNGAFGTVTVDESAAASASAMEASFATSRRLLSVGYDVEYDQSQAYVYGKDNGATGLSPSLLVVGLILSLIGLW